MWVRRCCLLVLCCAFALSVPGCRPRIDTARLEGEVGAIHLLHTDSRLCESFEVGVMDWGAYGPRTYVPVHFDSSGTVVLIKEGGGARTVDPLECVDVLHYGPARVDAVRAAGKLTATRIAIDADRTKGADFPELPEIAAARASSATERGTVVGRMRGYGDDYSPVGGPAGAWVESAVHTLGVDAMRVTVVVIDSSTRLAEAGGEEVSALAWYSAWASGEPVDVFADVEYSVRSGIVFAERIRLR